MKMKVSVLTEKEHNGKDILFPEEVEIETSDVYLLVNNARTISLGTGLLRLTEKTFKALKKELIRTKAYERITVI